MTKISDRVILKKTSSFLQYYKDSSSSIRKFKIDFAQLVFWRECKYEESTYNLCEIKVIPGKYAKDVIEDLKIVSNFK